MERIKGFTLVEMVVAMGIFGLISAVIVGIYFQLVQSANRAVIAAEVEQTASYLLEIMVRQIRSAPCIEGGGGVLEILDSNCENTEVSFYRNGEVLVKEEGEGFYSLNNPEKVKLVSLIFTLDSSKKSVKIELTMESARPAGHSLYRGTITLQETVSLRQY